MLKFHYLGTSTKAGSDIGKIGVRTPSVAITFKKGQKMPILGQMAWHPQSAPKKELIPKVKFSLGDY